MDHNRKAATAPPRESPHACKSQSLDDQQFEGRQRIAERLVQALLKAGFSFELSGDDHARSLKRKH
jgi:hypothetical protein